MNAQRDDTALLGRDSFPSPREIFAPGTTIDNRFRIIGRLSQGPRGQVYITEHMFLEEKLAIRILHDTDDITGDPEERFMAEARTLAKLNHKNIVKLFDVGVTSNGFLFATMELLKGETFDQWLEDNRAALREGGSGLNLKGLLHILRQVADGLTEAHDAGVFHHNLKPSNIYLNEVEREDGRIITVPKVIDFGHMRKMTDEREREIAPYVAPEIRAGKKGGAPADVYSFGVILHEAIVGHLPVTEQGGDDGATARATPDPSMNMAPLPPGVARVLQKAVAAEPEARFETIRDLMNALDSAFESTGVQVDALSSTLVEPDRDRGMYKVGVALFAALLVVLVVVGWIVSVRLDEGAETETLAPSAPGGHSRGVGSEKGRGAPPSSSSGSTDAVAALTGAVAEAGDAGEASSVASSTTASPQERGEARDTATSPLDTLQDEAEKSSEEGDRFDLSPKQRASVHRLMREGKAALKDGRWGDARRPFEEVIAINPDRADAYLGLGRVAFSLNDYDTAVEQLEKALRLRDRASWRLVYGEYLLKVNRRTEAVAAFRAVLNNYADVRPEIANKARKFLRKAGVHPPH